MRCKYKQLSHLPGYPATPWNESRRVFTEIVADAYIAWKQVAVNPLLTVGSTNAHANSQFASHMSEQWATEQRLREEQRERDASPLGNL